MMNHSKKYKIVFFKVCRIVVEMGDLAVLFGKVAMQIRHGGHRRAPLSNTLVSVSVGCASDPSS